MYLHNRYHNAIHDCTMVINKDPNHIEAFYSRGDIFMLIDTFDKALKDYSIVIQLDPNRKMAYKERGICLLHLGKYPAALESFKIAEEKGLKQPSLCIQLYYLQSNHQ